jgi:hypothetical protein
MKQIDFNALVHSVSYWLCYQDRIGRAFMIQEASIKYPVADYLTGIAIPLVQIELEFVHPELKNRRIDLVTSDKTISQSNFNIVTAFEFKIAKEATQGTPEKQRIFNDLMRMYLMNSKQNSKSYFMIVGKHNDYLNFFRNISNSTAKNNRQDIPDDAEGFYTEWFNFNRNQSKTFDIANPTTNEYGDIYKNFIDTYEEKKGQPKLTLPSSLTTVCIAFSSLIRDTPNPYVGGIWEIKP